MHVAEEPWGDSAFDVTRKQRIAGSGWDAQIVFEHPPFAVLPLHQILAGDMREHTAGRGHAIDLRKIAR